MSYLNGYTFVISLHFKRHFEQAYVKIRIRPRFCFDSNHFFIEGLYAMS